MKAQEHSLKRMRVIIGCCAGNPDGCSFGVIEKACDDIAPATLTRLLKSMVAAEFLRKDSERGRYRVGDGFMELAERCVPPQTRDAQVKPYVDKLANSTGQSSVYFDRAGDSMVNLVKNEQPEAYHYRPILTRMPLMEQGFGVPILAHMPSDDRDRIIHGDRDCLRAIDEVLREGCFARHETTPSSSTGAVRVVAPVLGSDAGVIGSIGVTTLISIDDADRIDALKKEVLNVARELSERLGE
jgi:DNA-binding IclR family transcriptional regulator